MYFTNICYIDSILSIIVSLFILINALKNIKLVVDLFLEKTPNNIDVKKIKQHILKIDGVCGVHHIHVRSIDGYNNYLILKIMVNVFLSLIRIKSVLKEMFIGLGK